jgi:UDPglucose 6-dehydrogenase
MHIAIIGASHVAVVAAAGFADFGNDVVCTDGDAERIARFARGEPNVQEPGLAALLAANLAAGRLRFTTDLEAAVLAGEVVILAPDILTAHGAAPDLGPLFEAADRIGRCLDDRFRVIATKCTVPVGTTDRLAARIGAHTHAPFAVASNPAFLKEGDAVNDFLKPDRILIGSGDARATEVLRRLYAPFVRTRDRILVMDARSAELTKFATSALLASRISFMNDLAQLADELGADIEAVRKALGADPRIGPKSLFVGPGFGGSHFQSDVNALLFMASELGRDLAVVRATHEVNQRQRTVILGRLERGLGHDLERKVVGVWGLAFKPQSDDVGHAPALALVEGLLERGAVVRVHDPLAMPNARRIFGDRVHYAADMYAAAEGADALVLVTEWRPYRRPDFPRLLATMRGRLLLDGRNIWEPAELRELGFTYVGLGRR